MFIYRLTEKFSLDTHLDDALEPRICHANPHLLHHCLDPLVVRCLQAAVGGMSEASARGSGLSERT